MHHTATQGCLFVSLHTQSFLRTGESVVHFGKFGHIGTYPRRRVGVPPTHSHACTGHKVPMPCNSVTSARPRRYPHVRSFFWARCYHRGTARGQGAPRREAGATGQTPGVTRVPRRTMALPSVTEGDEAFLENSTARTLGDHARLDPAVRDQAAGVTGHDQPGWPGTAGQPRMITRCGRWVCHP